MAQPTTTVTVQPSSSLQYYGYHLAGLDALRGPLRIRFDRSLPRPSAPSHGIAVVVGGRKVWIDGADRTTLDEAALAWCDVYGVVNVAATDVERSPKVVPIGPSFGIARGGTVAASTYSARAAIADRTSPRRAAALVRDATSANRSRLPLGRYEPMPGGPRDGVFYVTTAWNRHPEVAEPRRRFIRAAQGIEGLRFEGGFAPQAGSELPSDVDPRLAASGRVDLPTYLAKLQRSVCTFDAPAVHGCTSWKLGEALCLGKAIVAVDNPNVAPAPLVHGDHVHRVPDDEGAMGEAIDLLASDAAYRAHLEHGARAYWERWLHPSQMLARLLDAA